MQTTVLQKLALGDIVIWREGFATSEECLSRQGPFRVIGFKPLSPDLQAIILMDMSDRAILGRFTNADVVKLPNS